MIAFAPGARVWLAGGVTDMRRGMPGLALMVQEGLKRDPHAGDVFVFRGRGGSLLKILWHDGVGMSLYAKRLEKGRFIWPTPADGAAFTNTVDAVVRWMDASGNYWLNARMPSPPRPPMRRRWCRAPRR